MKQSIPRFPVAAPAVCLGLALVLCALNALAQTPGRPAGPPLPAQPQAGRQTPPQAPAPSTPAAQPPLPVQPIVPAQPATPGERSLDQDNATRPLGPQSPLISRDLTGLPLPKDLSRLFSRTHLSRMYEEYKEIIWAALVLAGLQTFIILALLVNMAARRKAQDDLSEANASLDSRVEARVSELTEANALLRDAAREKDRSDREQRETVELLKSIMRSIPAGVMVVDAANGTVADLNPTAAGLCGLRREDMVGRDYRLFLSMPPGEPEPDPAGPPPPAAAAGFLAAGDGPPRPVARVRSRLDLSGQPHLLEVFMDISGLVAPPPLASRADASEAAHPEKSGRRGNEPETFEPFSGPEGGEFGPKGF